MKGTSVFRSLVLVCTMLALGSTALADVGPGVGVIGEHFLRAQPSVGEVAQKVGQQPVFVEGIPAGTPGLKSPGKALLFSAIIPGMGELYVGAEKRAIGFLAVETASWAWYFTQHSSGKDKEDEYMDFADVEWSEDAYLDWYRDWEDWYDARKGDNDPDFDKMFTHHLPAQKDGDYYEMIGKYDQFSFGWVGNPQDYLPGDFAPNDSLLGYTFDQTTRDICRGGDATATVNRDRYANLRGDANDLLKRATWGISASLFNHVISALDAALAAKAFNRRSLEEAGYPELRMGMDIYAGKAIPKITLTKRF
ncbi:hypothetical protein KAX22_05710 [bacterium]|nr:hypothetical protein [bacterium]